MIFFVWHKISGLQLRIRSWRQLTLPTLPTRSCLVHNQLIVDLKDLYTIQPEVNNVR